MPRYDYQCAACQRRFEVVHGLHDDGPTSCPLCGIGPVRKAFAAPAIHFKGSGWAKKERRSTPTTSTSDPSSGDGATGSAPAEGGAAAPASPGGGAAASGDAGSTSTASGAGAGTPGGD